MDKEFGLANEKNIHQKVDQFKNELVSIGLLRYIFVYTFVREMKGSFLAGIRGEEGER